MSTKRFQLADHIGQTLIMDIVGNVDDDQLNTTVAISRIVVVETDEEYDDVKLGATAFPTRAKLDGMTLIGAVGTFISEGEPHPQLMGPTHEQIDAALELSAQLYRRAKQAA